VTPSALLDWRTEIRASDLPSTARLVALVLSMYMDGNGGSCFPSLTTIAEGTGLGRSTVIRALAERKRAHFIQRVKGGPTTPNRYRATSPVAGLPLARPG
jgi:hypothetical protein